MIRRANIDEFEVLTEISFDAKRYWNYPQEYYDIWKDELTITKNYIESNEVFLFEENNIIKAYYSLIHLEKDLSISGIVLQRGWWLEHMFLRQYFIKKGIGSQLFDHMIGFLENKAISKINILVDPKAAGFYKRMGCDFIEEYPSSIEGRTTPYYIKRIN